MRIWQMALCTTIAASLAAQENDQGFRWVGFRAGSISFDPLEYAKPAPNFGAQGGVVFDQQHFGLSFEGLTSHPKSDLLPGKTLNHSEASVTFMTALSSDASSKFWPYLGLGLGGISVPKVSPSTLTLETTKGTAAHLSLGFLHRPAGGFIWGLEGRYLLSITPKDLREVQGSVMGGFTWGGRRVAARPVAAALSPEVKVPLPSVAPVAPVVTEVAPPPPPAPRPSPVVTVVSPPPPPAPRPTAVPVAPPVAVPPVKAAPTPAPVPPPVTRKPAVSSGSTITERLDALLLGDMPKSVELGRKRIEAIPANHWTIRLEIASLTSTLKNAVAAFPAGKPDLFIAPIKLKGGKTAYQLFLGDYPSKAEAERAAKAVPAFFLEGGQRPKPFLGVGIANQAAN